MAEGHQAGISIHLPNALESRHVSDVGPEGGSCKRGNAGDGDQELDLFGQRLAVSHDLSRQPVLRFFDLALNKA